MTNSDSTPKVLVIAGHKQLLPDLTGRRLARCERGWTSDDYSDTAGKRREAHRMHKEDIRRAQT